MKRVFIGGSRKISRLNDQIRQRLDQIIEKHLEVLIGDANGADKAVQKYLAERQYRSVRVFCTGGECRNNVAEWEVHVVTPPHRVRDFTYFTAKDAAMAREAEVGFMLWDGESSGTIVNVARLIDAGKPVVVYVAPDKEFVTVRSREDLELLLAPCRADVRSRIEHYVAEHAGQPAMF